MIHVVHLEDQRLFCKAVSRCLNENLPLMLYVSFKHSDKALKYIESVLVAHSLINVIITDFTHIGVNGFQFALKVRELEAYHKSRRQPILLLTMMELTHREIQEGLKLKTFDRGFNKDIEVEAFIESMKDCC